MLNAGRSSDAPLVTGRLFAQDAREGACSGWFGVAHLAEAASTAAPHLAPPPLSSAVAGTRERGSAGKGPPPAALVLLASLLLIPRARAGAVPIHATHPEKASPKSAVPALEELVHSDFQGPYFVTSRPYTQRKLKALREMRLLL